MCRSYCAGPASVEGSAPVRCGEKDSGIPEGVDRVGSGGPRDDVLVRLSRGAGLPPPWPDVLGLAVRVPGAAQPVDLLLSTTRTGRLGRLVPVLRRDAGGPYSSIMGYRSPGGTLRFAARVVEPGRPLPSEPALLRAALRERPVEFTLAVARGTGPWRGFATLTLGGPLDELDPDLRFDAVRHPPPQLVADGPLARFRAPAYARAQAERNR